MRRRLLLTLLLCGCNGTLNGGLESPEVPAGTPGVTTRPNRPRPGTTAPEPMEPEEPELLLKPSEEMAYGSSKTSLGLRRLTRQEYVNSVRDLLGTTVGTTSLTTDVPLAHFDNNAHGLTVALPTARGLQTSAEQLSTAGASSLSMPAGCNRDALTTACVRTFLTGWLRKAFRRPATDVEVTRYETLFTALVATTTSREALAGVLEASLLSSAFLYRTEVGARDRLSAYEMAARLSYLVWSTTPDEALLDAARDGRLSTGAGRAAELKRLWEHPKAKAGLTSFARQWLGVQRVATSRKNPSVLEGTGASLQSDLELEFDLLVERQLLPERGSLESFLAGKQTYVTPELAKLYGLSGVPSTGVSAVSLEGTPRRGALTSGLLIAAHSKESGYSVPQFGAFFRKDVLCQPVPAPPVEAQNAVPPPPVPGETYRSAFDRFTGGGTTCISCHAFLNPPGFAFLPFDPIGRHAEKDVTGQAFDTRVDFVGLDGKEPTFNSAAELVENVAKSQRVRACLTRMTIEYTMGRTLNKADGDLLDSVTAGLVPGKDSLFHVVEAIVSSDDFTRSGPTTN